VLWFTPYTADIDDNNPHGNVVLSLPTHKILKRFGSEFYFIDTKYNSDYTRSRIYLSRSANGIPNRYPHYDFLKKFSPLYFDSTLQSAVACIDSRVGNYTPHELMVGIEVNDQDCAWLFSQCTVSPQNHSLCRKEEINTLQFRLRSSCSRRVSTICDHAMSKDKVKDFLVKLFSS